MFHSSSPFYHQVRQNARVIQVGRDQPHQQEEEEQKASAHILCLLQGMVWSGLERQM